MTDETIEGAGIDKPFMELFFKGEQSNFREQIEDMETKKGNIIASLNADGSNKVEGKWTGNTFPYNKILQLSEMFWKADTVL